MEQSQESLQLVATNQEKIEQVKSFVRIVNGKTISVNSFKRRFNPKSAVKKYNITKEQLQQLYCVENKNSREISGIFNCSQNLMLYKLRQFGITSPVKKGEYYWTNKNRSEQEKQLMSEKRKGKSRAEERYNWKDGSDDWRGYNWTEMRLKALKRDNFLCQNCNGPGNQVHHIVPFRSFNGEYIKANEMSNLMTVCASCHTHIENIWNYRKAREGVVLNVSRN